MIYFFLLLCCKISPLSRLASQMVIIIIILSYSVSPLNLRFPCGLLFTMPYLDILLLQSLCLAFVLQGLIPITYINPCETEYVYFRGYNNKWHPRWAGHKPYDRHTAAGPCQKRGMFEQGPRRNTWWRQLGQGWQGEAGRAAAITGSTYQTQQAGCCLPSCENGLDWKMKLNKPNCQWNQTTAVELGPLN